jgi:molybdopterin-containing oxidoreductase family membrane subunit
MLLHEMAISGRRAYWTWVVCLLAVIAAGFACYLRQLDQGLVLTGLSRDVSWGLYIGQFTFTVGIAASAVMLVLPYYLHHSREFGKIVVLGECVAIAAVVMCMLFIFVDMGQPARVLNVLWYASPHSMMFWDMVSLAGYLLLNAVIATVTLGSERKDLPPPSWLRPVIVVSIPWAISIHTVTAFLYCGLPGRPFWQTAILAPRFLASAFASGPALLILLWLALCRLTCSDAGREAVQKLAVIMTYAMLLNVFFVLLEIFTAFYSQIPEQQEHFRYLFFGLEGHSSLVPWMWISAMLAVVSAGVLLSPRCRRDERTLAAACAGVFVSLWIDKGIAMVVGGFVPSPLGKVTEYAPTLPEVAITAGIWAMGALLATVLIRIAISVRNGPGGHVASTVSTYQEVSH